MRIYEHFRYTGAEQSWTVPEGVTEAKFECWGAAGGMPSDLARAGKKRQLKGGTGPANKSFTNSPTAQGQLGVSYPNNAGYAMGVKAVDEGDVYYVYVGGNGQPGHSTIKLEWDGTTYSINLRGGAGGWNGGGDGGKGGHVHQNLYNSSSTKVTYRRASMPGAAKAGQLWYDTDAHLVKKCNTTYHSGGGSASKWDQVTAKHSHSVGPSGGGGGGATDIRMNGDDTSNRILVAGGGGGAGGSWNKTGASAWALQQVPATPAPPFGTDTTGSGPSGPDNTWASAVNYLTGGWGGGGMGGSTGPAPNPSPTTDGGAATPGGSGGPSTGRHADGKTPGSIGGSGGKGGTATVGGARGSGGSNGSNGSLAQGGTGADADGGYDNFCAGGGGGGGGFYGGGGGGQGFQVTGDSTGITSRGGGGGGGSNYVSPLFTSSFLGGCARPPLTVGNHGTGANGLGGFARITFNKPPVVRWKTVPRALLGGSTFDAVFTFIPAVSNGSGIAYYVVGTGAEADSFPSSQSTIMVTDPTTTEFTHTFTAPATGNTEAIFVQVVDLDGDASAWLKQNITGLAAAATSTATITSPAAGTQFIDSATVDWTLGTQTPLAAYRLGLSGTDLVSGAERTVMTGWRRGGSRVNLALDPGFEGSNVWTAPLTPSTDHPGISGSCGKIVWPLTEDESAEVTTTTWDNLNPGTTYRLHLEIASNRPLDTRMYEVQVWDDNGLLSTYVVQLGAEAAGTYVPLDMQFTPHTQGVYVRFVPSATGLNTDVDPVVSLDFEDGTTGGFTGTVASDGTQSNSGDLALKATGTGTLDITAALSAGLYAAGDYLAQAWVYAPVTAPVLTVSGAGIANTSTGTGVAEAAWQFLRIPVTWDGVNAVTITINGDATNGIWWDDVEVYPADNADAAVFGNTDTGQVSYLANMLLELVYEEDAAGYGAYFDGSHLNGLTGTVSWSGTANDSPSYLTGTDVVTDSLDYSGAPLNGGSLFLDTLTEGAVLSGYDGSRASIAMAVNPSLPVLPTVALTVDNTTGLMTLSINAADGAATNKTVSFDVFRNGTRIATGLTPDLTTRQATYVDAPGHGVETTYVVRAFDSEGGYMDQSDGSVTVVN